MKLTVVKKNCGGITEMPILRVYSIFDEKAEEFSPPFFQQNDRMAMRTVTESAKGNGSMLSAYPEDFKMYRIGEFNTSAGVIQAEDRPVLVCAIKDLTRERHNVEN